MNVFVVNLDRDVDRMRAVRAQLDAVKLGYERISAVFAKAMPKSEKRSHVNAFRWWCATGRPPRDGEIGCALSHYAIYRRMISENMTCACILEDDVVIDPRVHFVLSNLEPRLNAQEPMVVLLSNHSDPFGQDKEDGDNGFHSFPGNVPFELRATDWDMFTEGYVITLAGAKALLKANYPLRTPCDAWPRWVANGNIKLFHAFPTVCSQNKNEFASTTVGGGVWVDQMNPLRRLCYKAGRWIGKKIDRVIT